MNKTETVLLCRYAKAMCPAQAIDEYTPDAWADVLFDVDLEEAKTAIQKGVRDHGWRFIDVTEIVAGVRSLHRDRLTKWVGQFGPLIPPYALGGDPQKEREWLRVAHRQVLDGSVTHPSQLGPDNPIEKLAPRDVASLGVVGHEVPRA